MAIEITPKQKIKIPIWVIIIGILCVILVLAFLASYFYLYRSVKRMSQEIEEKNLVTLPLEKAIGKKEGEIFPISQKIDDFNELLSGHKKPLKIFEFLERTSLPNVLFSTFDFTFEKGELTISGQTDNFVTIEQQVLILKQEPLVKNLNLSGLSMSEEGGINFTLSLTFDSQIFK